MADCTWESALQFLHRQHSMAQQRDLDWQLERQLLEQRILALEKQAGAHLTLQEQLKKRVQMLEAAFRDQKPAFVKVVNPEPAPPTARLKSHYQAFLDGIISQISHLQHDISSVKPVQEQREPPPEQAYRAHLDAVRAMVWQNDNLLSCGDDGLIISWLASQPQPYRFHTGPVFCLATGSDMLFSSGLQGSITCSTLKDGTPSMLGAIPSEKNTEPVWSLSCNSSLLLSSSADRKLRLFQVSNGSFRHKLKQTFTVRLDAKSKPLAYSVGLLTSRMAVAGVIDQRMLAMHNLDNRGCQFLRYTSEEASHHSNQLIQTQSALHSGHEDGIVRTFDCLSGQLVKGFQAHRQGVSCLDARQHLLFSGGHEGDIKVWDVRNWKEVYCIKNAHQKKYEEGVLALACSQSGVLASGGADGIVKTYNFQQHS